jgi:hypothetical protein
LFSGNIRDRSITFRKPGRPEAVTGSNHSTAANGSGQPHPQQGSAISWRTHSDTRELIYKGRSLSFSWSRCKAGLTNWYTLKLAHRARWHCHRRVKKACWNVTVTVDYLFTAVNLKLIATFSSGLTFNASLVMLHKFL